MRSEWAAGVNRRDWKYLAKRWWSNRTSTHRLLIAGLVGLVLGVALVGGDGGGEGTDTSTSSDDTAASSDPPEVPTAEQECIDTVSYWAGAVSDDIVSGGTAGALQGLMDDVGSQSPEFTIVQQLAVAATQSRSYYGVDAAAALVNQRAVEHCAAYYGAAGDSLS